MVQFIPHFASVEMAWGTGKSGLARPHATKVAQLAEESGTPYLRVAAMVCAGLAEATECQFSKGANQLREAINFARSARAGLEFEARMLADLSDTLYRAGNLEAALETAGEAVVVARRRTDRIAELHATVLRGLVLVAAGDTQQGEEVRKLIKHAENLLDISGAAFFEPQLVQLRSQLERLG